MMAGVASPTQHDDIFGLLKSAARIRLVMDVQALSGGTERALVMGPLERQRLDPKPVIRARYAQYGNRLSAAMACSVR